MVDVPREGAFKADMVLMWQARARKAEIAMEELKAQLDKVREIKPFGKTYAIYYAEIQQALKKNNE